MSECRLRVDRYLSAFLTPSTDLQSGGRGHDQSGHGAVPRGGDGARGAERPKADGGGGGNLGREVLSSAGIQGVGMDFLQAVSLFCLVTLYKIQFMN